MAILNGLKVENVRRMVSAAVFEEAFVSTVDAVLMVHLGE